MSVKKKLLLRLRAWAGRAAVGSIRMQLRLETLSDKLYDKLEALEPGDKLGKELSRNAYLAREKCALLYIKYTREVTAIIDRAKRRSDRLATLSNECIRDTLMDICTNANMNASIRSAVQEINKHREASELEHETDRDESSATLGELWKAAREAHKLALLVQENHHTNCVTRKFDNARELWHMVSSSDATQLDWMPGYTLAESARIMRIVNQDM
ncbi:MAG: hypothetical protein RR382_00200 [Tannerellaceae bacterium]